MDKLFQIKPSQSPNLISPACSRREQTVLAKVRIGHPNIIVHLTEKKHDSFIMCPLQLFTVPIKYLLEFQSLTAKRSSFPKLTDLRDVLKLQNFYFLKYTIVI